MRIAYCKSIRLANAYLTFASTTTDSFSSVPSGPKQMMSVPHTTGVIFSYMSGAWVPFQWDT